MDMTYITYKLKDDNKNTVEFYLVGKKNKILKVSCK